MHSSRTRYCFSGACRLIQTKNPCKSIYYYSTEATTNSQSGLFVCMFLLRAYGIICMIDWHFINCAWACVLSNDFIGNALLQIIADKFREIRKIMRLRYYARVISKNKSISVQFKQLIDLFGCNRKMHSFFGPQCTKRNNGANKW